MLAGRQKSRWIDVLMGTLKRCYLLENLKEKAKNRGTCRCLLMDALSDLNDHMERQENEWKDVRKKRREEGVLSETLHGT